MKKYFKKRKFKRWHKNSLLKKFKKKLKRKNREYIPYKGKVNLSLNYTKKNKKKNHHKEPIIAPKCLSLLKDSNSVKETIIFFRKMRNNRHISVIGNGYYLGLDISEVTNIDFSTICVLKATIEELKSKSILVRGNFPKDKISRKMIEESGLLNLMTDLNGRQFETSDKSELILIQTGKKKLLREDNIRISKTIKKTVLHLTKKENHCSNLKKIILEICGNSIEWGGTKNRAWLLGVKYNKDEVIFAITDVGNGILKTLNRKYGKVLGDIFTNSSDSEILMNAFVKKYGSSSEEENRNKGLPSIKRGFEDGLLKDLKVITNNVSLNFANPKESLNLRKEEGFRGTLYRWAITNDSLKTLKDHENN